MAMSTLAMAAVVGSTLVGTIGSLQQAEAQSAAYKAQQAQSQYQAELYDLNSRKEAANMGVEATRLQAKQIAAASASGYELDSGSFMDLVNDSAENAKLDREDVLRTGRLQAEAKRVEADSYGKAAKSSKSGGWVNAAGSLFQGTTSGYLVGNKAGWWD